MKHEEFERQSDEFFRNILIVSVTICGLCVAGFLICKGLI